MLHLFLLCSLVAASPEALVRGVVRDSTGLPLSDVTVYVAGSQSSTLTDPRGRFELSVPPGTVTLVAFRHGMKPRQVEIAADAGTKEVQLVLEPAAVREVVTVTAPLPTEDRLRPLDILRMPGGQADTLHALQTFPGVVKVDEGAGLFVRGGDNSEVLFLLDGSVVNHPYRFETPKGGLFGSVDAWMLEGLSFSTGGFSARFSNALSAVLDLRGLGRPTTTHYYGVAGLAGTGGSMELPLGSRAGLRLSGNRSFTRLLFAVNGSPRRFDHDPESWNLNGGFYYDSPSFGSLKVYGTFERENVGVEVFSEEFGGLLDSGEKKRFVSAQWRNSFGPWHAAVSLGEDHYHRESNVGIMDLTLEDRRRSWRGEVTRTLGQWTLRGGTDGDQPVTRYLGTVPVTGGDYGATRAGVTAFDAEIDDWRAGGYVEGEKTFGRFTPTLGLRIDRFSRSAAFALVPRADLAFRFAGRHGLRLAWGRYDQAPSVEYFDRVRGTATLPPMEADHLVGGYEYGSESERLHLRVEGYRKRYMRLPLELPERGFSADGYGSAHGVDVFMHGRRPKLDWRVAYTWLYARRRWSPAFQNNRYDLPDGAWQPDFSVPQTLQAIATYSLTPAFGAGLGWRIASGGPFTPVVGATRTESGGYTPVYGLINSARFPAYDRVDASVTYRRTFAKRNSVVAFLGLNNVLAHQNINEFRYSPDFSVREPVNSLAPRSLYFGVWLSR